MSKAGPRYNAGRSKPETLGFCEERHNPTFAELRPLMPKVLESLPTAKPGQALVIRLDT